MFDGAKRAFPAAAVTAMLTTGCPGEWKLLLCERRLRNGARDLGNFEVSMQVLALIVAGDLLFQGLSLEFVVD